MKQSNCTELWRRLFLQNLENNGPEITASRVAGVGVGSQVALSHEPCNIGYSKNKVPTFRKFRDQLFPVPKLLIFKVSTCENKRVPNFQNKIYTNIPTCSRRWPLELAEIICYVVNSILCASCVFQKSLRWKKEPKSQVCSNCWEFQTNQT